MNLKSILVLVIALFTLFATYFYRFPSLLHFKNNYATIEKTGKSEFIIALAAGSANGRKGTMQELQDYASKSIKKNILPKLSSNANLVWGPAYSVVSNIFRQKRVYYTNGVTVIQLDTNSYAISIAGTNSGLSGWLNEDFNTRPMIQWNDANKNAKIFRGFNLGLTEVTAMKSANHTLIEFLISKCKNIQCTISVQGHSLGGALAPLVALKLVENNAFYYSLIRCIIFAGPTVGNTAFVSYYTSKLGHQTTRYDNQMDVIPRGFNLLHTIPHIYDKYLNLSTLDRVQIKSIVGLIQLDVFGLDPQAIRPDLYPAFTAPFNYSLVKRSGFLSFLAQIFHQHVAAYCTYFNVIDNLL